MILLASKNKELANSFIQDLEQEGFQVNFIENYDHIITNLYQKPDYHMIILDMENQDSKVSEICQKIKKDPQLSYIPLICMVKKDLVVEQLVAFELGADEFLYIPYSTPELQLKMRSIQRLLNLQQQLKEKENQIKAVKQVQKILVTLSHYINNSLTPVYSMVQVADINKPEDMSRLTNMVKRTAEFITKVLKAVNNLAKSGEMKVVKEGVYKDLMLDIESELEKLQDSNK